MVPLSFLHRLSSMVLRIFVPFRFCSHASSVPRLQRASAAHRNCIVCSDARAHVQAQRSDDELPRTSGAFAGASFWRRSRRYWPSPQGKKRRRQWNLGCTLPTTKSDSTAVFTMNVMFMHKERHPKTAVPRCLRERRSGTGNAIYP